MPPPTLLCIRVIIRCAISSRSYAVNDAEGSRFPVIDRLLSGGETIYGVSEWVTLTILLSSSQPREMSPTHIPPRTIAMPTPGAFRAVRDRVIYLVKPGWVLFLV